MTEANRLAAWLTEGAWHQMTLGDVIAAGRELRRLQAENEAAQSAVKTLEQLGYTYHGGELCKPPLGKAPDFSLIDSLRAENEALQQKVCDLRHKLETIKAHIQADCL
jgi:cell division protein FtsB